jgi:hypothetical protein
MFRRTLRGFRPCPRRASGAPPRASKGQVVREDGHATRPLRPDWGALHHKGGENWIPRLSIARRAPGRTRVSAGTCCGAGEGRSAPVATWQAR